MTKQKNRFKRKKLSPLERAFYKVDREAIWIEQGRRCKYCGRVLKRDEITMDHVIPISKTKHHSSANCVVACEECNSEKGNSDPAVFENREMNWLEQQLYDGMQRLEMQTRRFEYRFEDNTMGGFNRWNKYWEKRGRFAARFVRKPKIQLSDKLL